MSAAWSAADFGGRYTDRGRYTASTPLVTDSILLAAPPPPVAASPLPPPSPQRDARPADSDWFADAHRADPATRQRSARLLVEQRARDRQQQQQLACTTTNETTRSKADFGKLLVERVQKCRWLNDVRTMREDQSDYERYSLEFVLRRRYDTTLVAPDHMEAIEAVHWERTVLRNAMQAAADRGLYEFVLVLTEPNGRSWTEATMRTVHAPDLFGRAVHYLVRDVLTSQSIRVWYDPQRSSPTTICLCLSWHEAAQLLQTLSTCVETPVIPDVTVSPACNHPSTESETASRTSSDDDDDMDDDAIF